MNVDTFVAQNNWRFLLPQRIIQAKPKRTSPDEMLFIQQKRLGKNIQIHSLLHKYGTPAATMAVLVFMTLLRQPLTTANLSLFFFFFF
jgi:hypothetical protein